MANELNKLREIVNSSKAPIEEKKEDPRDAVSKAELLRSDEWLEVNKHLPSETKHYRWKTEVKAGALGKPLNLETTRKFWELDFGMHPKGPKYAEQDYLDSIYGKLNKMGDAKKEAWLRDTARFQPPGILNGLFTYYNTLTTKAKNKTLERARYTNIREFSNRLTSFAQDAFTGKHALSPYTSLATHAEDMTTAYQSGKGDIGEDIQVVDGRIATVTDNGEMVPVYAQTPPHIPWEESVMHWHDLYPVAQRQLKPVLDYSRSNAELLDRTATMELGEAVKKGHVPAEFVESFMVDAAQLSLDPMLSLHEAINSTMVANMEHDQYGSVKDITRDYLLRWERVAKTIEARSGGVIRRNRNV